jgi:hypothetical protein
MPALQALTLATIPLADVNACDLGVILVVLYTTLDVKIPA